MPGSRRTIVITRKGAGGTNRPRSVNRRNLGRTRLVIAPVKDQVSYRKATAAGDDQQVMDLVDKRGNVYGTFVRHRPFIRGRTSTFEDVSEFGRRSKGTYTPTGDGKVIIRLPMDEYDGPRRRPGYYEGSPVQWARDIAAENLF